MLGFCVFALVARRTLLADGVAQHILAAQPWHSWAVGCAVLTALFAQSFGGCWAAGILELPDWLQPALGWAQAPTPAGAPFQPGYSTERPCAHL